MLKIIHEFICGANNMYHGSFDQDLLNLKLVTNSDVNTFPFSTEWFCHFIFYFLLNYFSSFISKIVVYL